MKIESKSAKLLELLEELETLFTAGTVSREEYDCLRFILNQAYSGDNLEMSKLLNESVIKVFNN